MAKQPNPELPSGYEWGIALSSRFRRRPPMHLVSPDGGAQMVCTGGRALVENGGGAYCRACLAWLREYYEAYPDDDYDEDADDDDE